MFISGKLDNAFLSFVCAKLKFKAESECNDSDVGIALIFECLIYTNFVVVCLCLNFFHLPYIGNTYEIP